MTRAHERWRTLLVAGLFLLTMPAAAAAEPSPEVPGLGMNAGAAKPLTDVGAPPDYASYWVGRWTAQWGWGGLETALANARAAGATPVVYWYYWGDAISPSCVEEGCRGTKDEWRRMTSELADVLRRQTGGGRAVVVLENEFNKGGIDDLGYAPTFDGYLAEHARTLKAVPGVEVALGYGAWNEGRWGRFPTALEAADYVGFQLMRASTRDTEAAYRASPDRIASLLDVAKSLGKPGLLYDLALSSYPEETYRAIQADTLKAILDRRAEYGKAGLAGLVYRELVDNPNMGTNNYFGIAEQFWGLRDAQGRDKPSMVVWVEAARSLPPPQGASVPGSFEAEAMAASTGGRASDPSASGGAAWNLWSNGRLTQALQSDGGVFRVSLVARGTPANGVDARMEARLDGGLLGTWSVPDGPWSTFTLDARIPAGASTLAVHFVNDIRTTTEDRNLYVDVVHVVPVPSNQAPVARFSAAVQDLTLRVDASASTDGDGDAMTYQWDFGDGNAATGATATHTYAGSGSYTIRLLVDDGRESATAERTVAVTAPNRAPTASFSVAGSNLSWSFDGRASSDPDGDTLAYAWSFGDGTTATGPTASKTYAAAGTYSVSLTVRDGAESSTATRTVTAVQPNRAPTAILDVAGEHLAWRFDGARSSDPDGDALTYRWDFGDGTGATGTRAEKTYAQPGSYAVTLTVADGRGGSATASALVQAQAPPVARFAEAEAFARKANGAVFDDATASAGRAWLLWSNGDMAETFAPGAGSYRVGVTAKGDYAGGWPVMELRADGALVARWTVSSSSWRTYSALVDFGEGAPRTLSVHFTNDYKGWAGDRNLRVDALRLDPAVVSLEAESFAHKANGAAFDDATASAGRAWLLWTNGAVSESASPGPGTWRVEVRAKGDYAGGWPVMELRADGALVARWTVSSSSWRTYAADVPFEASGKTLSVHFTNDYNGAAGDRNLRVDVVKLGAT